MKSVKETKKRRKRQMAELQRGHELAEECKM
jgi:hypothetical protein